jgi:hypothetical protein
MIKSIFNIKDQHLQNTCIGFVQNGISETEIISYINRNKSMFLKGRTDVCFVEELKYGGEYEVGVRFNDLVDYFLNKY